MFYYFVKNICFQNKRMTFHLEEKNIESLPTEIIGEILNYCSITDIINFEQVYPQHVLWSPSSVADIKHLRYYADSHNLTQISYFAPLLSSFFKFCVTVVLIAS